MELGNLRYWLIFIISKLWLMILIKDINHQLFKVIFAQAPAYNDTPLTRVYNNILLKEYFECFGYFGG